MHAGERQLRHITMTPAVGRPARRVVDPGGQQDGLPATGELDLANRAGPTVPVATTRDERTPRGRDRATIPYDVRVSTADPGSSAITLAYRQDHRVANWGPSSRSATTRLGPIYGFRPPPRARYGAPRDDSARDRVIHG
jgi:hypothetical protein